MVFGIAFTEGADCFAPLSHGRPIFRAGAQSKVRGGTRRDPRVSIEGGRDGTETPPGDGPGAAIVRLADLQREIQTLEEKARISPEKSPIAPKPAPKRISNPTFEVDSSKGTVSDTGVPPSPAPAEWTEEQIKQWVREAVERAIGDTGDHGSTASREPSATKNVSDKAASADAAKAHEILQTAKEKSEGLKVESTRADEQLRKANSDLAESEAQLRQAEQDLQKAEQSNSRTQLSPDLLKSVLPNDWVPCTCPDRHPNAGLFFEGRRWHTPALKCSTVF
jgi:hypothetical protein